jgi:hypothetical protein
MIHGGIAQQLVGHESGLLWQGGYGSISSNVDRGGKKQAGGWGGGIPYQGVLHKICQIFKSLCSSHSPDDSFPQKFYLKDDLFMTNGFSIVVLALALP